MSKKQKFYEIVSGHICVIIEGPFIIYLHNGWNCCTVLAHTGLGKGTPNHYLKNLKIIEQWYSQVLSLLDMLLVSDGTEIIVTPGQSLHLAFEKTSLLTCFLNPCFILPRRDFWEKANEFSSQMDCVSYTVFEYHSLIHIGLSSE